MDGAGHLHWPLEDSPALSSFPAVWDTSSQTSYIVPAMPANPYFSTSVPTNKLLPSSASSSSSAQTSSALKVAPSKRKNKLHAMTCFPEGTHARPVVVLCDDRWATTPVRGTKKSKGRRACLDTKCVKTFSENRNAWTHYNRGRCVNTGGRQLKEEEEKAVRAEEVSRHHNQGKKDKDTPRVGSVSSWVVANSWTQGWNNSKGTPTHVMGHTLCKAWFGFANVLKVERAIAAPINTSPNHSKSNGKFSDSEEMYPEYFGLEEKLWPGPLRWFNHGSFGLRLEAVLFYCQVFGSDAISALKGLLCLHSTMTANVELYCICKGVETSEMVQCGSCTECQGKKSMSVPSQTQYAALVHPSSKSLMLRGGSGSWQGSKHPVVEETLQPVATKCTRNLSPTREEQVTPAVQPRHMSSPPPKPKCCRTTIQLMPTVGMKENELVSYKSQAPRQEPGK
ncbi:hypothetical protein B0H19DRAFT_1060902 [Mycena capillaripes]|nr:hypothetical protein B0H19DRAFT_1060902 [Mycena capillaripes]